MTEALPELNIPLIVTVVKWAEAPEKVGVLGTAKYDQGTWGSFEEEPQDEPEKAFTECGSSFCIAGATAAMSGYYPTVDGYMSTYEYVHKKKGKDSEAKGAREVGTLAAELLGLSELHGEDGVFFGSNTLGLVKAYFNDAAERRGLPSIFPDVD